MEEKYHIEEVKVERFLSLAGKITFVYEPFALDCYKCGKESVRVGRVELYYLGKEYRMGTLRCRNCAKRVIETDSNARFFADNAKEVSRWD